MKTIDDYAGTVSFVIGNWTTPLRPDRPYRWFAYVGDRKEELRTKTFSELMEAIQLELENL